MEIDPELAGLLSAYPVTITLPVQWGDQDALQHVNNTVFFRWFESVRIAYWGRTGMDTRMRETRVGPIMAAVACDFRRQVTYPDTVLVGARVARIGRTSVAMEYAAVSASARAVAAEGRSTVVVFDYNAGTPVPVPDEIRLAMEAIEGRALSS
jgi:acyl-CoA thioester hydrolase